ncbi:adenylate/guanylate cyclase domain-containing protein [Microvirga antarctica]|uniref:adenylate/guanylate cyclase domain-containing protein n=1 Tax=Microvirga antarctica TaxID=2819233 RepID=UPI001B30CEC9|nr:adenylate/guanylate cyclase domain-containing protein [Microvirga antarctica]
MSEDSPPRRGSLRPRVASAWSSFRHLRTTHQLSEATYRLIREADVAALRRAGLARIVVAALLFLSVVLATASLDITGPAAMKQIRAAELTLVLFGALGWLGGLLAARRIAVRKLPAITASLDALLVLGNLAYSHWGIGLGGEFFAIFPVAWVVPITMAAAAIHYQPRLQVYVAAVYVIGLSVLAFSEGVSPPGERSAELAQLAGFFSPQSNLIRIVMVFAAALILILVARQGRLLLERAVRETTLRVSLTRYLPRELAPILSDRTFDDLRAGQRISATLLFVDIRASSSFGESMDPARLAIFISSFRRRVVRAATQHGGMIDKFTGDGALILFGVPAAGPDDATRALACGRTLLELVRRWNAKRNFEPALRIGIGIHTGEMFCGVVGDDDRLEFTVLGETVNTAARIEQATKNVDCDCLASWDVVAAAGEEALWHVVECEPLPGVSRKLVLLTPNAEERV